MKPFDRTEASDTAGSSERLRSFTGAIWKALVPRQGECASVQGELIRANERLTTECFQNGMGNYYVEEEEIGQNYYGRLALFILNTLMENRGGALDADDLAYFAGIRGRLETDRALRLRIQELEIKEGELTEEEGRELEALCDKDSERIPWEALFNRAERCIANWCIANPELIDRRGRPVEEGGVRSLEQILDPPAPPPKCPLCGGRGFIQPRDDRSFPERCSCQARV